MKIQKEQEEEKGVEGYIDNERRVFVVTKDNYGLEKPIEQPIEQEYKDVNKIIKKYKPNFE